MNDDQTVLQTPLIQSICSWEVCGKFDVWIYGMKVLLKFVDLIFPGGTVDIINIPEPPLD